MKRIIVIFSLTLFAFIHFSCRQNVNTNEKVKEHIEIENDGVKIAYQDSGDGDTCLLFIHGWAINKEYWQAQVEYFNKRFRIVTIDLPGFGESGKNRTDWSVEKYGKDISKVLTELKLNNVILIGHSMSGAIIVEAALKNPDKIIGIVGVDNFKDFGVAPTEEDKKRSGEAYKKLRINYTLFVQEIANKYLFSPSTDSIIKAKVINDFMSADSTIAAEIAERNDEYPLNEKLKAVNKTLYLINSSEYPTDTVRFKESEISCTLYLVGPTGHYPMIEAPDKFNKALDSIINRMNTVLFESEY
ncbi:MAG: alpha/beta hydrolase [Saprospiraceae bacterium]|nr:alpha/beta hydrolase [Saprospiraceae bacterium]